MSANMVPPRPSDSRFQREVASGELWQNFMPDAANDVPLAWVAALSVLFVLLLLARRIPLVGRFLPWPLGAKAVDPLAEIEELADAVENAHLRSSRILNARARVAWRLVFVFLLLETLFLVGWQFGPAKSLYEGSGFLIPDAMLALCVVWPLLYLFLVRPAVQGYFQWRVGRANSSLDALRTELLREITEYEKKADLLRTYRILQRGKLAAAPPRPTPQSQPRPKPQQPKPKRPSSAPRAQKPTAAVVNSAPGVPATAPTQRVKAVRDVEHSPAVRPSTPLTAEEAKAQRTRQFQHAQQQQSRPKVTAATLPQVATPSYTMPVPRDVLSSRARPAAVVGRSPSKTEERGGMSWLLDLVVGEPPLVPVICRQCNKTHGRARGDGRHMIAFHCSQCGAFNDPRHEEMSNADSAAGEDSGAGASLSAAGSAKRTEGDEAGEGKSREGAPDAVAGGDAAVALADPDQNSPPKSRARRRRSTRTGGKSD